MSIKVKFISQVEVKEGKKTLKAAKNANLKIDDSCEGKGKCGKCVIKILSGKLSEPTKQEIKVLGVEKINKGYRLSCQSNILEDAVIEITNEHMIKHEKEHRTAIKENSDIKIEENTKIQKNINDLSTTSTDDIEVSSKKNKKIAK